MNNLILSTRYRLIKARVLYYCLFFYSILLPICLSIQGIDSAHDESGNKIEFTGIIAYKMMGDQMIMVTYVTLILFLCIAIGKDFNNKTIYYEIMSGYSREKIVFSRLRVFIPISVILIIIASFIYVLVPTLLNGFYSDVLDYISIKEFIIRIILYLIIYIKFITTIICLIFICRNNIASGLLSWIMFCIPMLLIESITNNSNSIMYYLGVCQVRLVMIETLTYTFILKIIIQSIFSMLLMISIAIIIFKRADLK